MMSGGFESQSQPNLNWMVSDMLIDQVCSCIGIKSKSRLAKYCSCFIYKVSFRILDTDLEYKAML